MAGIFAFMAGILNWFIGGIGIFAFTNITPLQNPKVYGNNHLNPFEEFDDERFLSEFRMTKSEVRDLCFLLQEPLKCVGSRKCDLSLEQKVLLSLKTLGTGSFQNTAKFLFGVSQPLVSNVLGAFVNAMVKISHKFIYMPRNEAERSKIKSDMYKVARFPGILGLIDGTHVPLIAPKDEEYLYVNRRKFHSINVQAVCDANGVYLDVVAKYPGQNHDSYILQASELYDRFVAKEFGDGWLLGDSGYPLKAWLMTPISEPHSAAEKKFNKAHRKTRCIVERSFGILKSRWRILDHTGGTLCYKPAKVCKIILTCMILHNICRRNGTPLIDGPSQEPEIIGDDQHDNSRSLSGERQRQRLINNVFRD